MKKTFLILSIVLLALASQAQHIYNNGAHIVSGGSDSYWVLDNGNFILTSTSATNLAQLDNLVINSNSSLTLGTVAAPAYLTVSGTLSNSAGTTGLLIPPGSSLIESSGADAQITFNIASGEWHLISVPTSNATSGIFYGHYLQKHTEAANTYSDLTDPQEVLTPMKGYALWGDLDPADVTFAGPVNAGVKSFTTTYSGAGKGWNLVGNPYPSSIDWKASAGWTKTNVNEAIYVHKDAATWASFVGSTGANGGTRFIVPGQGFFVQAASNGTLAMTAAVRVHNATAFFKSSDEVVPNLVRLEVSGNGYKDEAVVRFLYDATAEFDGDYDAYKLYGDVPEAAQIYSTGSTPLSINSLPETDIVPVGIKAGVSGTYTIAATEINDLQYTTLEDTKTGIFTELANKTYTFSFDKSEDEMRFKLHFTMLGVPDAKSVAASVYSYQKKAYINMNNMVKGDIFIYNIAGQLVATKVSAKGTNEINLSNTGNYIVKVVTDKTTLIKKIFIQ